MSNKPYKKFAQGIFIVKAKNSSFNSDFSGLPRRLPDNAGTIYATDKALKYCVRKYLEDHSGKIFVWRRYNKESKPLNIDENYKKVFGKETPKGHSEVITSLASAIDVRLFGVTYAGKDMNVSLTGTTQISYGINKFTENLYYNSEILSPYQDVKKSDAKQQTLGNETKTLEAHYVYDFVINPNNLIDDLIFIKDAEREKLLLNEGDIELFKEAMCKGVSYVTSASMVGSESELFMIIEMNSEEHEGKVKSHIIPLMKELVKVESKDGKTVIDLGEVFKALKNNYKEYIDAVELYYDNNATEVAGGVDGINVTKKHIVTLKNI